MTAPAHTIARADPLALTAPARADQRAATVVLDAGVVVALVTVGAALLLFGHAVLAGLALAGALVLVVATVALLARSGRTIGHLVTGTRTVERVSGAPAGTRLLASALSGQLRTADLRRGRDPVAPALSPFVFAAPGPEVAARAVPGVRRAAEVTFDSGQRIALESSLLVGRSPVAPLDAPSPVFEWADLSRTLSKSHVRLEWDGTALWATDLGSTNGTLVRSSTGDQSLAPLRRTSLPTQATLVVGDRVLTVVAPA